jgi:hypothetical protein
VTNNSISWWLIIALWISALGIWAYVLLKIRQDRCEREPDPDAVMAQRQLYADGEFRRRWIRRSPKDLDYDRLDLECGHWRYYTAGRELNREELVECNDCARQYLRTAKKL